MAAYSSTASAQELQGLEEVAADEPIRLELNDRSEWFGILRGAGNRTLFVEVADSKLLAIDSAAVRSIAVGGNLFVDDSDHLAPTIDHDTFERLTREGNTDSELVGYLHQEDMARIRTEYRQARVLRNVALGLFAAADVLLAGALSLTVAKGGDTCLDYQGCEHPTWKTNRNILLGLSFGTVFTASIVGAISRSRKAEHGPAYRAIESRGRGFSRLGETRRDKRSVQFAILPGASRNGGGATMVLGF
jgi:hypothetical protein